MRAFALMVAAFLVAMPMSASIARADGIEPVRPVHHHRPRPHRHVELRGAAVPAPVVIEQGPEEVTLQPTFFSGGVGVDIGGGTVSSSTVIIRGTGASASAFAFASARASAGVGGGWGGHSGGHGGGHGGGGCGCR